MWIGGVWEWRCLGEIYLIQRRVMILNTKRNLSLYCFKFDSWSEKNIDITFKYILLSKVANDTQQRSRIITITGELQQLKFNAALFCTFLNLVFCYGAKFSKHIQFNSTYAHLFRFLFIPLFRKFYEIFLESLTMEVKEFQIFINGNFRASSLPLF